MTLKFYLKFNYKAKIFTDKGSTYKLYLLQFEAGQTLHFKNYKAEFVEKNTNKQSAPMNGLYVS